MVAHTGFGPVLPPQEGVPREPGIEKGRQRTVVLQGILGWRRRVTLVFTNRYKALRF